jgi:hypothetical protein
VKSGCVRWCSGKLSAGALLGSDDASGVADLRGADEAAQDDQSAAYPDAQPEGIE